MRPSGEDGVDQTSVSRLRLRAQSLNYFERRKQSRRDLQVGLGLGETLLTLATKYYEVTMGFIVADGRVLERRRRRPSRERCEVNPLQGWNLGVRGYALGVGGG